MPKINFLYVHRVKGKIQISPTTPIKPYLKQLLEIKDSKYKFSMSNKTHCNFSTGYHYRLIDVKVDDKGILKHFANIDDVTNCIYFDSFLPYKRIHDLEYLLNSNNIHLFYGEMIVDYVEICCRYQKDKIEKVSEAITSLIKFFNTNRTDPMDRMISDGEWYVRLVKNLFNNGHYFNLKNYLFVDNFKDEDQEIKEDRLPKLEIQIKESGSISKAEVIGIPIIKSIIEAVGLETVQMNKDYEIGDYQPLIGSEECGLNEKVLYHLKKNTNRQVLPAIPSFILNNKIDYRLVCYLWYKGASLNNICAHLNISSKTFSRSFKRLGKVIEKRGDSRSKFMFQVDQIELNNINEANRDN